MKSAREMGFTMSKAKPNTAKSTTTPAAKTPTGPAVKRRRAGEGSFMVSVHDNRVELIIHGQRVASCDVNGPEFYNTLFNDVKARIEKGE